MTLPVNYSFDYSLVQCLDILGFFCLFSSFFCLFWLDIPQRLVDITDMVQMGLSLSTSQQFAFWPGVALADGEHKLHLRWWELAVCPKGQWKVNVWSFCGGDLLHAHISLILLKWCSVSCISVYATCIKKLTACPLDVTFPLFTLSPIACAGLPTHPHSHAKTITHIHRGNRVMMPFMGLKQCPPPQQWLPNPEKPKPKFWFCCVKDE